MIEDREGEMQKVKKLLSMSLYVICITFTQYC